MERKTVLINLQESSNSRIFEEKNLIHAHEFDKVKEWINKNIESINKVDKLNCFEESYHDTISILGCRGSGKTSFLQSLRDSYKNNKDIEILEVIDPTLFEEKGHVFLTVISLIKEVVESKLSSISCNTECPQYAQKEVWMCKLQKLSYGLPSIDGIGNTNEDNWQDPEYIMNKGLKAVHAAKKLENNFHQFVEMSLKILDKKAFLLSFDDIDVNFKKGWPVLETLRKYLTTPLIITLISGDIDLYSKAIRKQQWKNFGKALLINEADKQNKYAEYNDLVTEMEGQYLQKVLKPEHRIHLNTLLEKTEVEQVVIRIQMDDDKTSKLYNNDIKKVYEYFLNKFGIQNSSQSEAYTSFLLSLPLRTQIQLLLQFDNIRKGEQDNNPNFLNLANIIDPFLSDLYEKQINVELAKSLPKMLNVVVLKLLLKDKIISEAYQLQPTTSDQSLNSSLTALSLLFAQKAKNNPYLIFDYIIKIGYVRSLYSLVGYADENKKEITSDTIPSIEGLCKHAELFQDKVLRDVAGNMTAYLRGFINYSTKSKEDVYPKAGTIIIKGLNTSARSKYPDGRIDFEFDNATKLQQCIAYIPLSISSSNTKNATLATYSIYGLLATLSDLIKENNNSTKNNDALQVALINLSQIRSYIMPNFKKDSFESGSDDSVVGEVNELNNEKTEDIADFGQCITTWIEKYPVQNGISPYLLGKISTRLFYALDNIENGNMTPNLGEGMRVRIIALLNAILLEDVKENNTNKSSLTSKLNLNNTWKSDKTFANNLDVGILLEGNFSLSKWLLSCPLLLSFLPEIELKEKIKKFTGLDYGYSDMVEYCIYENLKRVSIRRNIKLEKSDTLKLSEDNKSRKSNLPKFSGSANRWKWLTTIRILSAFDIKSYDVIASKDINKIRNKYRDLFSNKIQPISIKALIEKLDKNKNNSLVKEWMNTTSKS